MGALMAQRQAAQANQQLQKGVSPGVRASGPFAKQIAQAQKSQIRQSPIRKDPRVLTSIAAAMR